MSFFKRKFVQRKLISRRYKGSNYKCNDLYMDSCSLKFVQLLNLNDEHFFYSMETSSLFHMGVKLGLSLYGNAVVD
jgi:hypothetical protein